jgi:hypothetical protein
MKKDTKEHIYRVFVERHYIAVEWFDVRTSTYGKAMRKATAAANKLPDPRLTATDNGWISEMPVQVPTIGSHSAGVHDMVRVADGVYQPKRNT